MSLDPVPDQVRDHVARGPGRRKSRRFSVSERVVGCWLLVGWGFSTGVGAGLAGEDRGRMRKFFACRASSHTCQRVGSAGGGARRCRGGRWVGWLARALFQFYGFRVPGSGFRKFNGFACGASSHTCQRVGGRRVGLARGGGGISLPKLLAVHAMNLIYRPLGGFPWPAFVIGFPIHVSVLFDIERTER